MDAIAGTEAATVATAAPVTGTTAANRFLEQLKAFLVGHNVELEYQALQRGLLGYTDGRRITCGAGQASHVEFATLAHETTHVLLHFPADRSTRPDLTTRETEAEAVTYLLCAQLGIAGTEASVEYIQSYRGTPDTLDASLERTSSLGTLVCGLIGADDAGSVRNGGRVRLEPGWTLRIKQRLLRTNKEKRRIVPEALVPGASVAALARKHGVNANLLFG